MEQTPFDLRATILREHSKAQCQRIVDWVGDNQKRFDQLFSLFLGKEYRVTQRAAWPMSYCVRTHPQLINNKLGLLLQQLEKPGIHDAVKRNTVRLLQDIDIPAKYQGAVMSVCFQYVASPTEPVAIKAFAMTVLGKLGDQHPDILPELKLLIEDQLPHQTAAFKSRAQKLLKAMKGS